MEPRDDGGLYLMKRVNVGLYSFLSLHNGDILNTMNHRITLERKETVHPNKITISVSSSLLSWLHSRDAFSIAFQNT